MEISDALKTEIKDVQSRIVRCIQNHQALVLKLKEDPGLESQIKVELTIIQKQIVDLNERQKVLIQQLRKELEENITNGQLPTYNFNLYKVKPGQLESKKRRRKDLSLAPKVVSCRPTHSPPSLSPSPTPSSSSLSDDSVDYVSPSMMPIPVPKARPKLLPDIKDKAFLATVNRRDLRQTRMRKNQKPLSDEEVFKDIPVYYDPAPSPPPVDEKDLKARFMGALALIPKEMLSEILNRKVERKRRSTATNNPNFVYNNDWEIPAVSRYNQWKRSKTYLSPHKASKVENSKKSKSDDNAETKQHRKEKDAENDKAGKANLDDSKSAPSTAVEKAEGKSRNPTPDSNASNPLCFVCRSSGTLTSCRECNSTYHAACVSPNSSGCPNCKNKKSSNDEASGGESSKEEFISKCPNVAESYNKLKKYIEHHTESDPPPPKSNPPNEKEALKMELFMKNQALYEEKNKLEERATELSEALLLQEDSKNRLLKEEKAILAKIKVITDFVVLFQKTNEKKIDETKKSDENNDSEEQNKEEDEHDSDDDNDNDETVKGVIVEPSLKQKGEKMKNEEEEQVEEEELEEADEDEEIIEEEDEEEEVIEEEYDEEKSLSFISAHTGGDTIPDTQLSPEEDIRRSPKEDGIFEVSKASLLIDISNTENSSGSPSVTSKDSILELDEAEEQCSSQSMVKSFEVSDAVEYETPSPENEFY